MFEYLAKDPRRAPRVLLALCLGGVASTACGPIDEPLVEAAPAAIKNGDIWNPWTESSHRWTRNIVSINHRGCTGTLLNREWVMTAAHCIRGDAVPGDITVQRREADNSWTTRRGAELLRHPSVSDGVDVQLIRLDAPIDHEVRPMTLYSGSTQSLVGKTLTCVGYGATDVGDVCSASSDCDSGWYCKKFGSSATGRCIEGNDGRLRAGNFDVIADPVNSHRWYRFDVPNSNGQLLLPGDSGSTCSYNGKLTGVMKAGSLTNYNRQTSAAAFRAWVNGVAQPTATKMVNRPGAVCRSAGTVRATYTAAGGALNQTGSPLSLVCPARRIKDGAFSNVVTVPRLFVYDRHPTSEVCCYLRSKNPGGRSVRSATQCTSGASSRYQVLDLPSVYDPYSWSQFHVVCSVPRDHPNGASGVQTYRVRQANRL